MADIGDPWAGLGQGGGSIFPTQQPKIPPGFDLNSGLVVTGYDEFGEHPSREVKHLRRGDHYAEVSPSTGT